MEPHDIAAALGIELTDLQRQVLAAQAQGFVVTWSMPRYGRRTTTIADLTAAAAIANGESVKFSAPDPSLAEAARQRALSLLDQFDAAG